MACLWRVVVVRGVTLRGTSVLGLPLARDRNVASVTFWGWVPCRAEGLSGPHTVDHRRVVKLMTLESLDSTGFRSGCNSVSLYLLRLPELASNEASVV